MKVVKELPKSIYYSLFLRYSSVKYLIKNKKQLPILISMTSIKSRLKTLDIVVKGLLSQDVIPEKVVLWLHEDLKESIPKRLQKLEGNLFEINFSKLDCPHLKLVESLKKYSEKIIVTCDDDLIYIDNHLRNLYNEHLKNKKTIIGNRTTQIKLDKNNNYEPFIKWRFKEKHNLNNVLMPLGSWGVIYPPNVFSDIVFDSDLFLKLSPKADDLWFKCMSLINKTNSLEVEYRPKNPIPIIGSQKVSLKEENVKKNKNEIQWKALSDHFNLKDVLTK